MRCPNKTRRSARPINYSAGDLMRTLRYPQHESFSYNAQFHLHADNGEGSGYDASLDRLYQPVGIR
jgi:hypothetical protein